MRKRIGNRIRNGILRVLNARYSVSSWLWVIVSTLAATFMFATIYTGNDAALAAFSEAMPIDERFWVFMLVVTGLFKMYGMARDSRTAVAIGSFVAFCLWVFGLITFVILGSTQAVVLLILPILIFNAYLFLGVAFRERNQA